MVLADCLPADLSAKVLTSAEALCEGGKRLKSADFFGQRVELFDNLLLLLKRREGDFDTIHSLLIFNSHLDRLTMSFGSAMNRKGYTS